MAMLETKSVPLTPMKDRSYVPVEVPAVIFDLVFHAFIPKTLHNNWPDAPFFDVDLPDEVDGFIFPTSDSIKTTVTQHAGDDRGFFEEGTFRLLSTARVTISARRVVGVIFRQEVGVTHRRTKDKVTKKTFNYKTKTANNTTMDSHLSNDKKIIVFNASVSNPFYPIGAPIDYQAIFKFGIIDTHEFELSLEGRHDRFPGYEAFIAKNYELHEDITKKVWSGKVLSELWSYDPHAHGHKGPTPGNLTFQEPIGPVRYIFKY